MANTPCSHRTSQIGAEDAEKYQRNLIFYINQLKVEIENPDPRMLLVDYLRSTEVGLTGTKHSCGQGGCGSCTVMLSQYDSSTDTVRYCSANSCLRPLCALDGMQVTTIEGLGSVNTEVSPIQYEIAKCNGSQCGYCTPGFVMNMHGFLLANEGRALTKKEIEDAFDGSICRCTGFRPILYAMKKFASDWTREDEAGTPECFVDPAERVKHYDEPRAHFPDDLKVLPRAVAYQGDGRLWFRPLALPDAHQLMLRYGDRGELKLVVGNTTVGIPAVNPTDPQIFIDIGHIPELRQACLDDDCLVVGSAVTYTQLILFLEDARKKVSQEKQAGIDALLYMAGRTAGTIVRNVASLAGNTMLVARNATEGGHPFPSDLFTALCALDAQLIVRTADSESPLTIEALDFVKRYNEDPEFRKQAIIVAYEIPYTTANEYVVTYKLGLRHVNSDSLVNAGLRVKLNDEKVVEQASLVYGAIAPVAFHARKTESALVGKPWNQDTFSEAAQVLQEEVLDIQKNLPGWFRNLPYDGVKNEYRLSLAQSFFYKFFVDVSEKVSPGSVPPEDRSAASRDDRSVSKGTQNFPKPVKGHVTGWPIIKLSAFEQATGEAKYTQDLPLPVRGLQAAFVTSMRAHARFYYQTPGESGPPERVDESGLLAFLKKRFPGFVDYITFRDIPKHGTNGINKPPYPPDPWFCDGLVTCFGQSIGLVVADTEQNAVDIASYVRCNCVGYDTLCDIKLTIEEAREIRQFFPGYEKDDNHSIEAPGSDLSWVEVQGRTQVNGVECEVIHGSQKTGAQKHFYMETQSCLAFPGEGKQMVLRPSSQSPNSIQNDVADTLAIQRNQVEVDIQRVGGGYGGKTTRTPFVAAPVALAAAKLGRPVRLAMPRKEDSWMIGNRHPFLGEYSVAIACEGDNKGKILGISTHFYSNGGNTLDCSFDVMDCAQLGADNSYNIPNFFTKGEVCRTNVSSNGAMRSYGGIQSALIQEDAIEAAAHKIGMLPEIVREMNFYRMGDRTPYGQQLDYCIIREVWERLKRKSDFERRLQEVDDFNAKNRWLKRGIAMIPLKYGLGYNLGHLMQGGALIDVYVGDGSVLVSCGGVEVGQGILTKVAQVAAESLNVPLALIRVASTSTNVVPNPISTGATSGTDLNGGAVRLACLEQRQKLEQLCYRLLEQNGSDWCRQNGINFWDYPDQGWRKEVELPCKDGKSRIWNNIVAQAYQHRVDLSSQALYATPGLADKKDQQFYGYTYSAACSEVQIDVLTGETTVLRSDIVYDMGTSLNPAIDIGQIEGAFVMGIGNLLTEELVFQPEGELIGTLNTPNTWTYKPPAVSTIPRELNVDLFPRDDAPNVPINPNLLMSSKGVGEPPLVLASSVFFSIKRAILAARKDAGLGDHWFELDSPATVQRVREACVGSWRCSETARPNLDRKEGEPGGEGEKDEEKDSR